MHALIALAFVAAAPAEALDRAAIDVEAIPAPGRGGVPLNPLILLPDPFVEVQLVDDGAAIVETTTSTAASQGVSLLRVFATEALRPQTHYRLTDGNGTELTNFTTGDTGDDDAPAAPTVSFENDTLFVRSDEDVAVADVRVDGGASVFVVFGGDDQSAFFANGNASASITVVALDFAGNTSDPTEAVVDMSFPTANPWPFDGCAATPPSTLAPVAALLLLLRRRRR